VSIVLLAIAGAVVFLAGTAVLGIWIRRTPTQDVAVRSSRVGHALFHLCLGLPMVIIVFSPGLTNYDRLLGLPPLPLRGVALAAGILLAPVAAWLLVASSRSLARSAQGAPAFVLSRNVVSDRLYEKTRNPMSLGWYLALLVLGLLSGSTATTLSALLVVIPAHVFYLKFFEERELELRFGQSYVEYKRRVPFLLPRLGA
jgi:protein-S-isoprenylcysteine O-methyltransferase Ste14